MSRRNTKHTILQAAWDMMREDPAGAKLGKIAARAGVSRQALYLHFEGRAGLLLEMVRWVDAREQFFERTRPIAALQEPEHQLEGYVRLWLDYLPSVHPVCGVLARAKDDPEAHAAWLDRMAALEDLYREPLSRLEAQGRLSSGLDAAGAVEVVRATASVHAWEFLVHESGWAQERAVEMLWRGVHGALF